MMNVNKVIIVGNITRDPEIKALPSGQTLATLGIATNRRWNDRQGQKQEQTEFHNIVLFGRQAEVAGQYLKKGQIVCIEGRLQTRSWDGQDGSKRYRTEIVAENMQMGPRSGGGTAAHTASRPADQQPTEEENVATVEYPAEDDIDPNEIPF
ncbi:MAG: single-stranded DNA-binding protein [Candidatus Ryanbacteria bacterium CG10_big_fil_rev_8_21_14_0_10_43_42]|uniref:Single-stranded DNA-binding protein n=1 Tax=Candidatus Ryanbacteria bacterium CG10_big_fil_rev_8_21_14_0_10_43_42 TaxID=1974864 RepID=A0A2M8KX56_9BACT|nr:MAG: single-stranded DNA-binding protein [Candidatus Ryanbacteria bacterium CG10_big_fil_rev_8_21_14_0_10_43_42]